MILNHQNQFIFIHVPKCAGTTVTRALSPLTTFRDLELGGTKYGEALQDLFSSRFGLRKHSTAAQIKTKAPPHIWRRFFVFAFVRNPYARAFSTYRFLQRWVDGPHHGLVAALDFEGFLHSDALLSGDIEIAQPQVHWLAPEGVLVPGVDFVGRVEDFTDDFSFVLSVIHRKRMVWEGERHDNLSTEPDEWRSHMTRTVRTRIEDFYAADFDLWDYRTLPSHAFTGMAASA
ncbi:MAG: sulfotransferase family 2 domain-containing protein [Pseudomonadota bacterium]